MRKRAGAGPSPRLVRGAGWWRGGVGGEGGEESLYGTVVVTGGGISGRRRTDGISLSALSLRIGRGAAVRTAKNRASDMRYDNYCYFCGVRKPIRDRRFGRFRPPVGGYGNG